MTDISHKATMLAFGLSSAIEALSELPPHVAEEHWYSLRDSFDKLGDLLLRLDKIEEQRNRMFRAHQ